VSTLPLAQTVNLDRNYAEFLDLLDLAEARRDEGRLEAAAVYAQAAAQHAWLNPNGLFASDRLEGLVADLASKVEGPAARCPRTAEPTSVLHVVTQAYQSGGSTQFVACWIDEDLERQHRICLTQQGANDIPEKIASRSTSSGALIRLDDGPGSLLDRARALRRLALEAQVVLLNVHPHDVVPSIAFSGQSGFPPIIYVNHADHVFWLGTRTAETVLNMRLSGSQLAAERRGIEPGRSNLTCRPLRPVGRTISRDDAKRSFGLAPSDILIVTAADGSKYRSIGQPSLLDMILPAFSSNTRLRLLAAGPRPEGEWANAEIQTQGRIKALGPLPEVSTLHQAADIYLDSYPFASLTSLLEAGSFGTPSITYRAHPDSCAVLGADTHGLDQFMVRPTNPDDLRAEIGKLAGDDEARQGLGSAIQRAIVETHTGPGWRKGIGQLYQAAAQSFPVPVPKVTDRGADTLDELITLVMARTGYSRGIDGVLSAQLNLLPFRERVAIASGLSARGKKPNLRRMLPIWILLPALRTVRRFRSLRRS
jgi:hypothetical protein